MDRVLQSDAAANLPANELTEELHTFLRPLAARLPEKRLREWAIWLSKESLERNRQW
jgi:hypothetical protein